MEWISVEERLPKHGQAVLVYQSFPIKTMFRADARPLNRCFFLVLEWNEFQKQFVDRISVPYDFIDHWMPLPEKPEVKDEPK